MSNALSSGDRVAIIDQDRSFTYAELQAMTDTLADRWEDGGISERDTIAILSPDTWQLVAAAVTSAKVGARTVLLNTGFSAHQIAEIVDRENVTALVSDAVLAEQTGHIPPTVRRLTVDSGPVRTSHGVPRRLPRRQGEFVLLTGGTTGTPKGAPRSVGSPLAAAQFVDRIPMRRGQTMLLCAPLFHGTALSQLIIAVSLGHTVVLLRKFDAARAVEAISRHRCDIVVLVPTMLRRIVDLDSTALAPHDLSSVDVVFTAGAPLPPALGHRAIGLFGPRVYNFYGSTETGTATVATPADWQNSPGCVGKPPVGVRVRLHDPDSGTVVGEPGRSGVVYVRNSLSFRGYSGGGNKEIRDGYMSTGDLGHWDCQGNLHVDGRGDDMIVSGGENVFPGEVEALLFAHPKIAEAFVFGVDDEEFGQRLVAVISMQKPGSSANPTAIEVKSYVRDRLARFKVPRVVTIVDELPHTAAGKIDRPRARETYLGR